MSANTKIEWATHTFNPWEGCQKVGPGCDNCYAEARNSRYGGGEALNWGPNAPRRRTSVANWRKPLAWNAAHTEFFAQHGHRQRVFCASLADVFDNAVPAQWRIDLMDLIFKTPNLDWLLLTKRIGNAEAMLDEALSKATNGMFSWRSGGGHQRFKNLWLGATIVNQEEANRDIPKLLAVPAAKHFLSMEPLLGPVSFEGLFANPGKPADGTNALEELDWVIVGGESGRSARPMNPDWAKSLRDQCNACGTPFLFKQWGEWGEPDSIELTNLAHHGWFEQDHADGGAPRHEWPGPMQNGIELASLRPEVFRVGKKAAGRLLDGQTWNEIPA